MTKAQELAALDRFIAQLGPHSYLGPWLADNRLDIERDITSDCAIDLQLPGAARHTARGIIESAREERERITDGARANAKRILDKAQAEADTQRAVVAGIIRRHCDEAVNALRGGR